MNDKQKSLIREVFMRNGFKIKAGADDLADYVYAAAHELLQTAPAVQGEPVAWLRFRSHRVAADDVIEGLEICEPGETGDDGGPAFPVYTTPSIEQVERWRHDSEDLEALHNNLDDVGTPRHDSSGIEYSAWGRVIQYAKAAAKAEAAELAVQGEPVAHTFYVLHDATGGQKYIKKDVDDGCLAIFEREEDARRAKRRHPGTEYKRVDYYAAPQPAEQQPAPISNNLRAIHAMILNTLDRDAADGKAARGEMAAELRLAISEQQPAEQQPECGCCGQTDRCDDDCDAVVIGGHRAVEQQPAPDVAGLVEALESLLDVQGEVCRYDHQGYCQNHNLDHFSDVCRVARARAALAAYRSQGGVQS